MSINEANLTIKRIKTGSFYLVILPKKAINFAKNEVLADKWCKNYTNGNFTYR
jgi:hypothetical protein